MTAFLNDSVLGVEVTIDDAEALAVTFSPFEIVGECPDEVAADIGAGVDCPPGFC